MAEDHPTIGDLTYELIKKIHGEIGELRLDMLDLKLRTSATEEHIGTLVMSNAGIATRLDRIDERLSRVERRLELTESR